MAVDAASPSGELHRPWRPMIGSEHFSHALSTDTTGGRVIGEDAHGGLVVEHDLPMPAMSLLTLTPR